MREYLNNNNDNTGVPWALAKAFDLEEDVAAAPVLEPDPVLRRKSKKSRAV
jgi:hypothetical protein